MIFMESEIIGIFDWLPGKSARSKMPEVHNQKRPKAIGDLLTFAPPTLISSLQLKNYQFFILKLSSVY